MIKNFNTGVKSVPDLADYVCQLTYRLLIVSGLSFACSSSSEAMEKDNPVYNSPRDFYKDKDHPLTQALWKDKDLSERLRTIRQGIEDITEQLINSSKDPISDLMKLNSEHYRDILACSQCDTRASGSLIDAHLSHFKGTWDQEKINNIGCTNTSVTILSHGTTNVIAIKTFKDIEETPHNIQEGLKELLYSLLAYQMKSSPSELKMARIYDAIICPKNSLHLIMEGANTHDIHYFLATDKAESVVKACAHYLAKFHIGNYKKNKTLIKGKEYLGHKAEAYHKISYDPLKEKNELSLWVGKQQLHLEDVTAQNIIRLLSKDEQERFAELVKRSGERFNKNCGEIFRFLKGSRATGKPIFYFLTKTHGDAHGNNFFYNDEITDNEIKADSFYRISMIDYASIIRTYGGIGDPAEDVGRFLGSLWDWSARPSNQAHSDYGRIIGLQNKFLQAYLQIITDEEVLPPAQQDKFHKIFKENTTFYKFRFYKAIFNSTKDKDTKLRILRSWIQENADREVSLTNYILKGQPPDRPWKPIKGDIIHWLPNGVEGFIESQRESGESYLTSLWKQFNGDERAATISSTIAGMGGVGKTSLALAYAHEALENKGYHLIYWLLSETEPSLLKGYRDLLERINVPYKIDEDDTHIIELIKGNLPRLGKCLLIYDNVPNPKFLEGKVPEANHIDVLMTSRWNQGWEGELVDLAVFFPEDSVKYLLQTIGLEETSDNRFKAGDLAEELGHLPLALSQAAHYLKLVGGEDVSGDIISKYIKKFRETPIYHFEKRQNPFESGKSTINYEHLIARTFEMTREKLSDLAQQLMIYCAYLDPDQIATDIFIQANCSKEDIATALSELEAYSLIKRNRNTFSIHRLTQLVLRMEREKKENLAQVPVFFNNLLSYFYYYWSKFPMVKKEKEENFKGEKEEDFFVLYEINSILLTNLNKIDEHLRYHYKISSISKDIIATLGAGSILMQDIGHKICHYLRNKIFHKVPLIEQDRTVRGFSLKIFKEECLEKSINLTEEDYKLLFSFIPEMEYERDRTKLATVLAKIEPGQRQRILKMSTDLLPQKVKVYDIYCMIKTLSKINEADWDKITQFMRLLNPDTVRKDKEVMLSFAHIIAEIDKSDHRKFVKLLKEILFSPHRHNSPISLLFETFTEIKQLQWKGFIKLLDAILFSENTNIKNVSLLLKYFLMSEPKWKTIIEAVQIFSTQPTNKEKIQFLFKYLAIDDEFMWRRMGNVGKFERGYTRSLILKIFTIIDKPFFCEKFFQIAEILSDLNMDRYHTLLSIEAITKIEINNWSKVVLLLQTLKDKNMNGNQISLILDIIQKVNVSSWEEILKIVDPLFSLQIDKYDHKRIVNFIEFFIKIDSTNYRKMAEILSTLITQKMEIGEISHILNSLVKISPSEWESSIKRCQDLYPENGYILARILNSFSHIDIEKWDQVTKLVKTLYPITQHENDLTIMLLFEVFGEIDVSYWGKIVELMSVMLTQEIHLANISNTLKILVETKDLNWENVIKLGRFLNDSKIEFHHIWGAFDALLKIEESKREKVVSFILSLVSLKIDRKAIPAIIEIFEKVEESKWEKSAEIVRLLLPNFSSEFINIFTIKSLIEIESREIEEVAALAWPFFDSDIDNWDYYPALIQAIDKIVCKKNITPFDKIYFLLKGDIVKGEMEGWLKEIIRGQINGDPLNFVAKMNDVEKNFLK